MRAGPPCPLAAGGRQLAGSPRRAGGDGRRAPSSLASTRPATETAMSAVFSQISARAWSRAVAMSRWARCLAASASAWACLTICSAVAWASCRALSRMRPHLVGGTGHLLAVLGEQRLALVAGPLGLEQARARGAAPAGGGLQQRLPGELAQHARTARRRRPGSRWPASARPPAGWRSPPAAGRARRPARAPAGLGRRGLAPSACGSWAAAGSDATASNRADSDPARSPRSIDEAWWSLGSNGIDGRIGRATVRSRAPDAAAGRGHASGSAAGPGRIPPAAASRLSSDHLEQDDDAARRTSHLRSARRR